MDAEIIVSSLIKKLDENKSSMVHPMFGNPVRTAIENLNLLKDHLEDHPINDLETARLLKAVYSAEDAIDNLLSRKQLQLENKREESARERGGILGEGGEMEREYEELKGEEEKLRREKEELKTEEIKLRRDVEESQTEEKELRRKKEELVGNENKLETGELKREKEKLEYELRLMVIKIQQKEKEELQKQTKNMQKENEEFMRNYQKVLTEFESFQRDNDKLLTEKKESLSSKTIIPRTRVLLLRLWKESSTDDTEKVKLQRDIEEIEKLMKDKEELIRKKDDLKKKEEDWRRGEEDLQSKEKMKQELQTKEEELRKNIEELRKNIEKLETEKEKWQRENGSTELLGENKKQQRDIDELLKKNEEVQKKSKELLRENEDKQREHVKLLRENQESLRNNEKLQKDTEEHRSDEKFSAKREPLQKEREKFLRWRMNILDRKMFMCFKHLCDRIDFLCEMKKLKNEIKALGCHNDVNGNVANNDGSSQHIQQPQRWGKISNFCLEENHVVGFKRQIEDLMAKLGNDIGHYESPQPQVIKLIGVGGSGKSTLIRTVYNNPEVKLHFRIRAWVNVSSITIDRDLWIDLLKQIDPTKLVPETFSAEEMVSRIAELLKDTEYLIVIAQHAEKLHAEKLHAEKLHYWQALTGALCSSSKMGKIIIITQEENNARQEENNLRQENYFTVKSDKLEDEESWKLFSKKAGIAENDENLRQKILHLCNGSPLRLVMLGGLLSANKNQASKNRNYDEWLKEIGPASNLDEDIWDLCYQDLPSEVKPCLLYMALFPQGFEIPVRRLLHLWCAEGFVTSSVCNGQEIIAAEDQAEMFFEDLVIRNMIQVRWRLDGSPKACRMHSALYTAFCRKATGFGFLYNQINSSLKSTEQFHFARRFSTCLGANNEFSSNPLFHVQHIRTFVAFDTRRQGKSFIETSVLLKRVMGKRWFRLLKVLDLEGVYKPRNIEVVVKQFFCLSYLGLRSTFIDFLPGSVGELQYLETLDLKYTRIYNIPNQVWHARNLKHIYLCWINGVADLNSTPIQLPNLRTLWGLYLRRESSSVIESLGNSGKLRKLGLAYNSSSERDVSQQVSRLSGLQSLKLRHIDDNIGESEAQCLTLEKMNEHQKLQDLYLRGQLNPVTLNAEFYPPKLKRLTLSMSRLKDDPMPVLGQLPHLNILRLFADSYIGKEMKCLHKGFPKLRALKLWNLPVEQWTLEREAMPCLQELEIRSCSNLKVFEGSEHLTSLNDIVLTNMHFNPLPSLPTKNGYVKHVNL